MPYQPPLEKRDKQRSTVTLVYTRAARSVSLSHSQGRLLPAHFEKMGENHDYIMHHSVIIELQILNVSNTFYF